MAIFWVYPISTKYKQTCNMFGIFCIDHRTFQTF